MARGLLKPAQQRVLVEKVGKVVQDAPTTSNLALVGTGAGLATNLVLGQSPLSIAGASTGALVSGAIAMVDFLGPDGSMKSISYLYLPEQVRGRKLVGPEEASQFARDYLRDALTAGAQRAGYEVRCAAG